MDASGCQSYAAGLSEHGVDSIDPIFRRGVLLDVAASEGLDVLPSDFVVDADCLERAAERAGVEVRPGDVVLVRTGWALDWGEPRRFINDLSCPGINREAAGWLSTRGVFAGGSDATAFEFMPAQSMPVHVHRLVESGVHIIEAPNLEALAASSVAELLFAAAPLPPVALAPCGIPFSEFHCHDSIRM